MISSNFFLIRHSKLESRLVCSDLIRKVHAAGTKSILRVNWLVARSFSENGLSVKDTSARERALVLSGLFREVQAEAICLAGLENRAKLQTVEIFFLQELHCHHAILLQPSI